MKKCIIAILITFSVQICFGQGVFTSEEHKISMKYPADWTINEQGKDVLTLIYKLSERGKTRLAVGFSIVAEKEKFDGNMEKMAFNYHYKLKRRREMTKTEILSEEIIDFNGLKAIMITGSARIPIVKQNSNWKILLFEYAGFYFEVGLTASKKDFKNKEIKAQYEQMFDSLKLL